MSEEHEVSPKQPEDNRGQTEIRKIALPSGKEIEVVYYGRKQQQRDRGMEEYADRFTRALQRGHILPMDF